MPQLIYNNFAPGIKQDNYLTGGGAIIDSKNMDGLKEGIGITLGPKVNKGIITSAPIIAIDAVQTNNENLSRSIIGGTDGNIYKLDSSDNTPVHNIGAIIVQIVSLINDFLIFTKSSPSQTVLSLYKISVTDVINNNWAGLELTPISNLSHFGVPPVVNEVKVDENTGLTTTVIHVGQNRSISSIPNGAASAIQTSFPTDYVTGFSSNASVLTTYCRDGNVFYWNRASDNAPLGTVGGRVSKVTNLGGEDYVTLDNGTLRKGVFNNYGDLFTPNKSYRLEDNSQIQEKLNFKNDVTNSLQNRTSISAYGDLYFYTSDSNKGLYKYGSIVPGARKGIHKILTQNHEGNEIDFIYDMYFYETSVKKLYFSYKAGSTYGVDYIDLESLETCNDGYIVTEVATGGTAFKKEVNVCRISVSNVDIDNTVKLYYRHNNQDWTLLRTIDSTNDDIYYRENITKDNEGVSFRKFIDVQFKAVVHSEDDNTKPPYINEMFIDYTIINA